MDYCSKGPTVNLNETGPSSTVITSVKPRATLAEGKVFVPIRHGRTIFRVGKYFIFGVLTVDMMLYLWSSTLNEALDSIGWLLLLGVFEYESVSLRDDYGSSWEKFLLVALQILAYGIVLKVTITYGLALEWLDLANSVLWLLVCATIAYDIYAPGEFGSGEWRVRNGIKMALYTALVGCAVTWGIQEEWLDFFDASLWILCFALIELNIFQFEETDETAPIIA
jgi:hypothetical protein